MEINRQTHGEQHVFLVLVDGSGVGDSIGMLDHTDGLTCVTVFCQMEVIEGSVFIFVSRVCLFRHVPVRMDWSTRRVVDLMEMILMSAGTLSPTSVHTDRNRSSYSCRIVTLEDPQQPECSVTGERLRE